MTNRFLISVAAAALIAGTGFANAQGPGARRRVGGFPRAQQSAPVFRRRFVGRRNAARQLAAAPA